MSKLADFTTDGAQTYLLPLKEAGVLPDYINQIPEAEDVQKLPDVAFADSQRRLFPINNKVSAYLSAVSAFSYGIKPEEAPWLHRIKTACVAVSIEEDVKKAHEVLAALAVPEEQKKQATAEPPFAIHIKVLPDRPETGFYPIGTHDQIESSCEKIAEDIKAGKLPTAWFAEACRNLVKAAADAGFSKNRIPAIIQDLSHLGYPNPEKVAQQLEMRAQDGVSESFLKIYKEASDSAQNGEMPIYDAVMVWEFADKSLGLSEKYAGQLSPFRALTSGYSYEFIEKAKEASVLLGEDLLVPLNAITVIPDKVAATRLQQDDARQVLLAKRASRGSEATALLAELSEAGKVELMKILDDLQP